MPNMESNRPKKPKIGITIGDPAGIGPEVVLRALCKPEIIKCAEFRIYGSNALLQFTAEKLGLTSYWNTVFVNSPRAKEDLYASLAVFDFGYGEDLIGLAPKPSKTGGETSLEYLETATKDAMRPIDDPRHIDALITAPISKESWSLAGSKWRGHTEFLAKRSKSKRYAMMFSGKKLNVVLASTHIPLNELKDYLTIGRIFDPIDLGNETMKLLGNLNPKIAVTGLNPHASENGLLGDEEKRLISPAIQMARNNGILVSGPYPADTIFLEALNKKYDLVVAMYHDQGLIPIKLIEFDDAVNITIGLPFVRTSPDHGTGWDISGKFKARENSMYAAITKAIQLTSTINNEKQIH